MAKLKLVFVLSLLFTLANPVFASVDADFQLAVVGTGGNLGSGMKNIELSLELFNVFLYSPIQRISFKVSPFNFYWHSWDAADGGGMSNTYMSFLNGSVYYNFNNDDELVIGPFLTLEYFTMQNAAGSANWKPVNLYDFTMKAGLQFALWQYNMDFPYIGHQIGGNSMIVQIEAGYKYSTFDRHQFYLVMKMDVIVMLLGFIDLSVFFNRR